MKTPNKKPLCVVIGDVHYTVRTLNEASGSVRSAGNRAAELKIPLLVNGDLLDGKAIIRAEVANQVLGDLQSLQCKTYVNVGNHDLINERGTAHALEFLRPYAEIIDSPKETEIGYIFPYGQLIPGSVPRRVLAFVHAGVMGANMGHYIVDRGSIDPKELDGMRVFASHYHCHQDIKCGKTGLLTYVGSPYSTSFSEASDPDKGYVVVYSDGSYERQILDYPRHRIIEASIYKRLPAQSPNDYIWLKLHGRRSDLDGVSKKALAHEMGISENFKLELVPEEGHENKLQPETNRNTMPMDILRQTIENQSDSDERKARLMELAQEILSGKK
jgi:DNA repair exonuclease SbcCD nuclease subunit